jgi:predicted transcriptional regulator
MKILTDPSLKKPYILTLNSEVMFYLNNALERLKTLDLRKFANEKDKLFIKSLRMDFQNFNGKIKKLSARIRSEDSLNTSQIKLLLYIKEVDDLPTNLISLGTNIQLNLLNSHLNYLESVGYISHMLKSSKSSKGKKAKHWKITRKGNTFLK